MGDITTRQPSENVQKQFGQFYNFSHTHDVLVSELPPRGATDSAISPIWYESARRDILAPITEFYV